MELVVVFGVIIVLILALVGVLALTEKSQLVKTKLRAEIAKLRAEERDITTETDAWIKQEEARLKAVAERAKRWTEVEAEKLKADFASKAKEFGAAVEAEVKKAL